MLWKADFLSLQQLRDGENLKAGIAARKIFRFIEARRRGFREHGLGGFAQGDERAEGGLLPLDHAFQVAHVIHADVTALHLHHHLLGLAAFVVEEVDVAVDARVRALLVVLGGPRVYQVHRPPLELVRADLLQRLSTPEVLWRDDALKGIGDLEVEAVSHPARQADARMQRG